ncbi:hypothetical protein BH11ACT4_BH11ACT4_09770 [soil metagenome]
MTDLPDGSEPAAAAAPALGRASAMLASGTVVSRILGFISALVLAKTIGIIGTGADAFTLANQLPNAIYAIIAGGLLNAVLVPQIVRARVDSDGGQRFINRLLTVGIVIFAALAVLTTLAAPLLVRLYAESGTEGFDGRAIALATSFAYWCLPQVFFYALYSLLGEVLNARGLFGPFTWAPALNNVIAIAGLVVFGFLFGTPTGLDADRWTAPMIALLAGSATLGIAAQALVLFFFWRRAGLRFRPVFGWRGVGLGRAGKAAAWTFAMILVLQVGGFVETRVASIASGSASIAVLRYAWLIFMLPHSVATVSIATPYFTRMSAHGRDDDLASFRSDLDSSLRRILLIIVFASIGLMVIAFPISAVFAADHSQVEALGTVLIATLVGLVPYSVLFVIQRAFYALEDTRTPFLFQLVQTALFIAGSLVVATFPVDTIAVSLTVVLTIANCVQTFVAALLLRRRIGSLGAGPVIRQVVWFTLAALPAAAAGIGVLLALGWVGPGAYPVSGAVQAVVAMALSGTVMAIVYCAVLAAFRNREFAAIVSPLVRRIRRPGRSR